MSHDVSKVQLEPAQASRPARDPAARNLYATTALAEIPRLIGTLDRHPLRATYGSLDRSYWHYRTQAFPSAMYEEGVLPLALVYTHALPGNRWQGVDSVRQWCLAALRYAARSMHSDGSGDDYYPFERALGAAVFSLQAAARSYALLELDDPEILTALERRARWIARHSESGVLTNHHALAALGLAYMASITGRSAWADASQAALARVLGWQHDEGWFVEYGGADPGYQTVTIDCLAKLRQLHGDARLDEPLQRATQFARRFLHADASYAGVYGSRGNRHFYPHGFELLAAHDPSAADLADGYLASLARGTHTTLADDRMFIHRLASLLDAYRDWSAERPPSASRPESTTEYLPGARLLVDHRADRQTIVSAARGGVFQHFTNDTLRAVDAGLVLETSTGRVAVSQLHEPARSVEWRADAIPPRLVVRGPLHWTRHETATPLKQAVFHLGMLTVGRACRTLVRKLLQRRLITGRRVAPIELTRTIELLDDARQLRVTDELRLLDRRTQVRRLMIASDLEAAYVAASAGYQPTSLEPWTDLQDHVERLNRARQLTVVRVW